MGALDTSDVSSATSNPPSSLHSPPSSLPPARPGRPRPPQLAKSSPPPLVSLANSSSSSCKESVHQNTLPPPLCPTPVSSSPLLTPKPAASADQASCNPSFPAPLSSKLFLPPDCATSSSPPQLLTLVDRLVESASVWKPKGLSEDQIQAVLERTTAGVCRKNATLTKENHKVPFCVAIHSTFMSIPFMVFFDILSFESKLSLDNRWRPWYFYFCFRKVVPNACLRNSGPLLVGQMIS